jgi:hypothetical protein
MNTAIKRFRSKVDIWLVVVLAIAVAVMWSALGNLAWTGGSLDVLELGVAVLTTVFLAWFFAATYYVVTDTDLIVRSGPLRWIIALRSVERLRASRDPLSSPALSLDRIEVTYGSKRILVSPQDKVGFVRALRTQLPHVELDGLST